MASEQEIFILPDYIANQIAAGEVVQRPESVIKELVENSLDAGADTVTVVVKDSGKSLIHVIDNGRGMSGEDLLLSVKRHATSKIKTQADLEKIATLGFRGEALASVSAVASLEIRTKRKEDAMGHRLVSEPNKEPAVGHFNSENGTQVMVRNLFYNVPARKKFLKSNLTEFRHISETMMRFVLAVPRVRFVFYQDNDLIFDIKAGDMAHRIISLFDKTYPQHLMEMAYGGQGLSISGYIGRPDIAKRTRGHQFIFLNGRYIQSRYINHAVNSVLEHIMPPDHFPFYIIKMETDAGKVDVNIHPQKHEVKFEDETAVYNAVKSAVRDALRTGDMTPVITLDADMSARPFIYEGGALVRRDTGEVLDQSFPAPGKSLFGRREEERQSWSASNMEKLLSVPSYVHTEPGEIISDTHREKDQYAYWQPDTYHIIGAGGTGLRIYSLRRILEAVSYRRAASRKRLGGGRQELFFPVRIKAGPTERQLALNMHDELSAVGFEFVAEGDEIVLSAVPADIGVGSEEPVFREMLSSGTEEAVPGGIEAKYSHAYALHNLRMLSQFELKGLMAELEKGGFGGYTAAGKPVYISLPYGEIDPKFG